MLRLLLLVQFMQPQQQVLGRRLLILEWSSRTLCLSHQFRKVCMHKTLLLLNIVSLWYSLVEERTQHCLHSHFCCYPHMPVGRVWIYRLLFVCFFFVCMVMDFSAEDKANNVKFFTVVLRCPGQGNSHFGELCSSRSPKSDESNSVFISDWHTLRKLYHAWWSIRPARWPRVGSACVDIQPSPKKDVLDKSTYFLS